MHSRLCNRTKVSNFDSIFRQTYGLECGLEEVVREEVPAEVHEVVCHVHLPVLEHPVAQPLLGLDAARVDGGDQRQADESAH